MRREKKRGNNSHYDDQTIEHLKRYYRIEDPHSSDLSRFKKNMERIMTLMIEKMLSIYGHS
jgi:hypothetical protein